ncbi:unnamed protein product [Cladocopium goreaui]|uniref:Uncharacterized protein n=1 Tax=Cladocopium goreaui TaxID=2562237 RepID=A0A9P1DVY8_9DINO|nr:unnamed protein product [Cladocopium goreaui]
MWKRGAIFMAFRQAAQLKPLANRWRTASFAIFTMSQIHYQNMSVEELMNQQLDDAVVQIEKRFQSRLRRRRALLEAKANEPYFATFWKVIQIITATCSCEGCCD